MLITERTSGDVEKLKHRIRRERDAEQRDRYRAVLLAVEGRETKAIQNQLHRSRGFVQRWAYAYRDGGIEAVIAEARGGSQPRLPAEEQKRFIERIKAGPTEADGGLCRLGGQDGVRILQAEFGVTYSLNGVYKILHRNGLSCLQPRPRHRKSDVEAQQQWLDRAPFLSRRSEISTPPGRSRSGSRTRRGSGNKGR